MPSVPRMHQVRFTTQPELEPRLAPSATLVRDINPGISNSIFDSDEMRANVGGVLYFVANDGVSGSELWRSDGTSSGTMLVRDINPGVANSYLINPTNVGGLLYFGANDGVNGFELWRPTALPAAPCSFATSAPAIVTITNRAT